MVTIGCGYPGIGPNTIMNGFTGIMSVEVSSIANTSTSITTSTMIMTNTTIRTMITTTKITTITKSPRRTGS